MAKGSSQISSRAIRETRRTIDNLGKFERRVRKQSTRETGRKAMRPMLKTAKLYAQKSEDTGLLKSALRMKTTFSRGDNRFRVIVGIRKDVTGPMPDGFKKYKRVKIKPGRSSRSSKQRGTGKKALRRIPANYAHLVEFGTYRTRAKPFIRTAYRIHRRSANARFKANMEKDMIRVAERLGRNSKLPKQTLSSSLRVFI